MSYQQLPAYFDDLVTSGVWIAPLSALVAAFVFGQALAWAYERTYRGLSYSRGSSHTLVLVCIAASILVRAAELRALGSRCGATHPFCPLPRGI